MCGDLMSVNVEGIGNRGHGGCAYCEFTRHVLPLCRFDALLPGTRSILLGSCHEVSVNPPLGFEGGRGKQEGTGTRNKAVFGGVCLGGAESPAVRAVSGGGEGGGEIFCLQHTVSPFGINRENGRLKSGKGKFFREEAVQEKIHLVVSRFN